MSDRKPQKLNGKNRQIKCPTKCKPGKKKIEGQMNLMQDEPQMNEAQEQRNEENHITQPFTSRLSCPEITDEIASMYSDDEVVLISTKSQLQKIKNFSIYSIKDGWETAAIQIDVGDNDPSFFPLVALTASNVVTFSYSKNDESSAAMRWTATVFHKRLGDKLSECKFDGGSKRDASCLMNQAFQHSATAFRVTLNADKSCQGPHFQIVLASPCNQRLECFVLNDNTGQISQSDSIRFSLKNCCSISFHSHRISFVSKDVIGTYDLLSRTSISNCFTKSFNVVQVLREFMPERILQINFDEIFIHEILQTKLVFPFLALVANVRSGDLNSGDQVMIFVWDLANRLSSKPMMTIPIKFPKLKIGNISFDFDGENIIFWESTENQIVILKLSNLNQQGGLTNEPIQLDLNPEIVDRPSLKLIRQEKKNPGTKPPIHFVCYHGGHICKYGVYG